MYLKFEKPEGNVSKYGEFLQGVVKDVPEAAGEALLKVKGYVKATKEEFDKQNEEPAKDKKAKKKEREVKKP